MSAAISALNTVILSTRDIDIDWRILLAVLMFFTLFGLPAFFRYLLGKNKD